MEPGTRRPVDYSGLSLEDIEALLDRLEPEERDVSAQRGRAHDRIDILRAEVQAGLSPYANLVQVEAWERRLSTERKALHTSIDALYAERDRRGARYRRRLTDRDPGDHRESLLDPDGGRHGTLRALPPSESPLTERSTLAEGPVRLERPMTLDPNNRLLR